MKSAAAKGRRHLFLAAVCLVSTLLAVSSVEASRGVTTSLGPALSSPAMPDLAFEESHVEPQPRHRLFGDLDRLERPLGAVAIQKTASGVFALGIQSNVRQSGGLEQNRSGPTFQGLWTDPVTGIAYARNRWYDARTASWLSEDPLGAVDSPNLYAFVGWGPQAGRDPMGLYQEDFHFYAVYYISVLATGDTSRAARIAGASQHVDDFPGTFPARERFIDRNQEAERKKVLFPFHFMDASETGTSVSTQNLEMQTLIRGVSAGNSDIALGAALHTVADSYSHTSFSWAYGAGNNPHGGHPLLRFFAPPVGHARAGTAVDEPYKDPFLAATAGAEIYRVVREYAEGQGIDLPSRISEKELREELENLFRSFKGNQSERIEHWKKYIGMQGIEVPHYDRSAFSEENGREFERAIRRQSAIVEGLSGQSFPEMHDSITVLPSESSPEVVCGFWGCVRAGKPLLPNDR